RSSMLIFLPLGPPRYRLLFFLSTNNAAASASALSLRLSSFSSSLIFFFPEPFLLDFADLNPFIISSFHQENAEGFSCSTEGLWQSA
ncbi:MAG: hypothetical protein R6V12_07015, partial [Candidatus Hydrogenedentota bacterium]